MHKYEKLGYWKRMVFLLGFFKIPMIWFVRLKVLEVNAETAKVRIKLRRRTKNHLGSMYFGALAVGADVAGGIQAFYFSEKLGKKVSFAFKTFKAEFLKRAESDVEFIASEGEKVRLAVEQSLNSGERVNEFVKVEALNTDGEVVALFKMGISVKVY